MSEQTAATSRRTTWPVAVLAGLAGLGLALSGCAGTDRAGPTAGEGSPTEPAAVELEVGAAPAGRCMVPSVQSLQAQELAFEGTVTALAGGTATFAVEDWFKGGGGETVTVSAPNERMQELLIAVDFEVGETYLVSALDGQVSLCGLSAEKDERLAALYAEAYRG